MGLDEVTLAGHRSAPEGGDEPEREDEQRDEGEERQPLAEVENPALADGRLIDVTSSARVRVGRALKINLVPIAARSAVKGGFSLVYRSSARTLVARTGARGAVTLGRSTSNQITFSVSSGRVLAAGATASVVVRGTVSRSTRPACKPGTAIVVRLVDRDFRTARTAADVIAVTGGACGGRYPGEVRTS